MQRGAPRKILVEDIKNLEYLLDKGFTISEIATQGKFKTSDDLPAYALFYCTVLYSLFMLCFFFIIILDLF